MMKKSTKPWLPKTALGLARNAQESPAEAYQGVDISYDDLQAQEDYERKHLIAVKQFNEEKP